MDLLYQRYASPFSFMDGMIQTGRFCDFVYEFMNTTNREKNEEAEWEYYLHKVFDKSFNEFKEEIRNNSENQEMSKEQIETTVTDSLNILKNFKPENEGGGT